MAHTLVALDLETTGLEPGRDAIIEIGAIRFKGDRVEAEFSTLVNPGRKIPANVVQLTGINDAMVANAPSFSAVSRELEEFVGETPILGHYVNFDLQFLHAKRVLRYNNALDTLDLASVLLPTAARYSLISLAQELGLPTPPETMHRAIVDARVTMEVYRALFRKALELPLDLLAEIVQLGEEITWGAGTIFEEALRARMKEKAGPRPTRPGADGPLFRAHAQRRPGSETGRDDLRPLQRKSELTPLDIDELAASLEPAGSFSRHFPHYEYRSEQVEMLRSVARAFSEGRHLMVEAGTGTGKSVGYLIPAVYWAVQNNERVVVSTNTINLQDQLVNKDIPDLQAALGLDFRATVLKGRSNYLCPRRLDHQRRHRPKTPEEMRVLAKVLVWLHEIGGEADHHPPPSLGPNERGAWLRLSAEDEGCTAQMCQEKMGGVCPFYRARRAAHAAHIVIVNHALLFADIALENRVIPDFRYLVVDEAHHLEAATTDGLSFELSRADLERQLKDLGGPNAGLLGEILAATSQVLPPDMYATLDAEVNNAYDHASTALALTRGFFEAVAGFMEEVREGQPVGDYGHPPLRILPATRTLPPWGQVEIDWEQLGETLAALAKSLFHLSAGLNELEEFDLPERDDLVPAAGAASRRFTEVIEKVNGLVFKPDPLTIYWAEARANGERVALHAAPLHVGPLVQKHLWHAKESVVMTSATLTTAGDFTYLKGRLNADEADEMAVGSPFDYETSTLLYLVNDIPEPLDKQGHQKMVEQGLVKLCTATRGRALVLFTSYAQLKQTAQAIRDPLARAGIDVYDQSDGTSRTTLLDSFKTSEGGVLLGTKSFWEGVDVPGEALSVLVIVKLPFDVPSDPIIAARAETFERPFDEYTVPEAVLKFRQGFGRLIRSRSDRGVVAVFDRRMLTKQYGRIFHDSLPPCTRKVGPLAQLPPLAAKWIDGG